MSIYTARLLKGNQKPNPDFKQKGIATLQPCALGNSDIRGYPHRKQIAYSAYVQSLSAFLFATEKQERVSTSADGFLISLPFDKTLEHILPTLGVAFTKKITKDVLQAWEREYGVRVKENQGQTIYMFDEPTYELAKVMKERPEGAILESRTPLGVSSLAGLQAYLMSWKILTLFAATHTYPAFSTPLSDEGTVHNYASDIELSHPEVPEGTHNKRRKIIPSASEDHDMEEDQADLEVLDGHRRVSTLKEMVLVAKPAPFYPKCNFGPASAVPSISGLVFPYFNGLITRDYQTMPDIVWQYFLMGFGSSKDTILRGFQRWSKGMKTWIESTQGMEMMHMFYGIKLALEAQARVYFVVEMGQYQGFVLLGEAFSIVAHEREYMPVNSDKVRVELGKISIHETALEEIVQMLSNATIGQTKKRKAITREDITRNRDLYLEVQKRKFDDDEKDRLNTLAVQLSFPERYLRVSPESIALLLNTYSLNDGVWDEKMPMYIGSGLLFETDSAYLALSVFGATAPSFFTVGGEKKDVPALGKPDPLSVLDPSTKLPMMPVIPYTMKGVRTAMNDLYKVWKDRAIYVLPKERAGPSRTTQFQRNARDEVWKSLRTYIGGRSEDEVEEKKKHYGADPRDVVGGMELAYGDDLDFD